MMVRVSGVTGCVVDGDACRRCGLAVLVIRCRLAERNKATAPTSQRATRSTGKKNYSKPLPFEGDCGGRSNQRQRKRTVETRCTRGPGLQGRRTWLEALRPWRGGGQRRCWRCRVQSGGQPCAVALPRRSSCRLPVATFENQGEGVVRINRLEQIHDHKTSIGRHHAQPLAKTTRPYSAGPSTPEAMHRGHWG